MEYGIINKGGYLMTRNVSEYTTQYKDGEELKTRLVTVKEQCEQLKEKGWKPVDDIDQTKLQCENGYYCRVIPYDNGDSISYRYYIETDIMKIKSEIKGLKVQLSESDYKVTKCYEASLLGVDFPYDISSLHEVRQKLRDKINELEAQL